MSLERNRIYNEDCLETLKRMDDKAVDLTITSPPYNMRLRIRNGEYVSRENAKHFSKKYDHFGDDLPIDEFYDLHNRVLSELLRVSKTVCYNFQVVTGSKEAFFQLIGDFKKEIKDIIVWDKGAGQPAMHDKILNSCYEFVLVLDTENEAGRLVEGARFARGEMDNILRVPRGSAPMSGHGAVFPEMLVAILMEAFSGEWDTVYDPFMGTGTTAVVAKKVKRFYIGSEIQKEYVEIAERRIAEDIGLFNT